MKKAKIRQSVKYLKRKAELSDKKEVKDLVDESLNLFLEERTAYEDGTESMVIRIDLKMLENK